MSGRKILLTLLIVVGLVMLTSTVFIWGVKSALESKPVIHDNSVLRVVLSGAITERESEDAFSREFEGANGQLHEIRKALRMAAVDERIRGVYLRLSGPELGWAKAQALFRLLTEFKRSGKFVTAFIDYCDEISYYIAMAADRIYAQPYAFAAMNGFAAQAPFVKNAFDKLGIRAEVVNIGKYKSAGDLYKRASMSAAQREALEALLADITQNFVDSVSAVRGIDAGEFRELLNQGIFQVDGLAGAGLIDELKYESEVLELIKAEVYGEDDKHVQGRPLNMVGVGNYARISPEEVGLGGREQIALIYAVGAIMPGQSGHAPLSGRTLGSQSIIRMLQAARDNRKVRAVVLRVDSPGGSGQASDAIWAAVESVRKKKPVVVSMSDVAASGGYWIAMQADAIVCEPLTITGSIGVVSTLFDLSGAYDKLGINWETVKTAPLADFPTDKRPLTSSEWQQFKQMNRDFYQVFVQKVADSRGKSWDDIHAVAQGRIWSGERALRYGLVDTLGGVETALALAKEKAGIDAQTKIRWRVYPAPKGLLQSAIERLGVRMARSWQSNQETALTLRSLPEAARTALRLIGVAGFLPKGDVLALATDLPVIR